MSRARRVKCDETKPDCRRCADFGRVCEGYPELSTLVVPGASTSRGNSPTTPTNRMMSQLTLSDTGSRRSSMSSVYSFNEFRQYTMPNMPGYFATGFWPEIVERMSKSELAIEYALSALGAVHSYTIERQATSPSPVSVYSAHDSLHQVALQQYNAAITQLAQIMAIRRAGGTETILTCCYLFVCIETLFGNIVSAVGHAQAGLEVYRDWSASIPSTSVQRSSDTSLSNPRYCVWKVAAELEIMLYDLVNLHPVGASPAFEEEFNILQTENLIFHSLEQVSCALLYLRRRLKRLLVALSHYQLESSTFVPEHIATQHRELAELQKVFETPYHQYMAAIPPEDVDRGILVLQIFYLAQVALHGSLLGYLDASLLARQFEDLLDTAEMILRPIPMLQTSLTSAVTSSSGSPVLDKKTGSHSQLNTFAREGVRAHSYSAKHVPSFVLCSEIVSNVFHTAVAAPTEHLRQRAIALLHRVNAVEGIWNSRTAARVGEELLKAEKMDTAQAAFPFMNCSLSHLADLYIKEA